MSEKPVKERNKEEESIAALGATLTHNALEKVDIRLESKIDNVGLKIDYVIDSINGKDGLKEKVEKTNGKVRLHTVWIATIAGGAAVFMALIPTTMFFLKDYFVSITATAVVEQISDKYNPEIIK